LPPVRTIANIVLCIRSKSHRLPEAIPNEAPNACESLTEGNMPFPRWMQGPGKSGADSQTQGRCQCDLA
ncbi:MAG TPA: hypothetical protein PLM58_17245, partial [Novosphingobium sp.]|nr:hypothetical protein [Novosphingobium sp.]